ncbi:MAG TPA: DUF4397 domain-containing protein [Candidatus Eisenbacteria bacterium]|nr:DUF4397 domain-containing protein [Candidatus Eisenbacteria bacterium]
MTTHLRFPLLAMALFATVSLASCGSDDNSNPLAPAAAARVMAVHASPDAPAVDLLVDGAVAGTGLAFPNNTAYLNVAAGTRNVKVNVAGTTNTVINADVPVAGGTSYTVFASDVAASIGAVVLTDDLTAPASGKAHVRFVHLSPDAPAVDVAVQGGPVLFANKAFKQYTAFTPVDAGTYNLEVRPAGTTTVALPLNGIVLQAGKIYTVFAKGLLNGAGAQALGAQIIVNN